MGWHVASLTQLARLIESRNSSPYWISGIGRRAVRAQPDNRTS
nr:YjhX family toxin [Gemmobacter aquaticus]